jgi:hypothetical protein
MTISRGRPDPNNANNDFGGMLGPFGRADLPVATPRAGVPTVEYGTPMPIVYGTARVTPRLVYSRSRGWSSGAQRQKVDGTWETYEAFAAASVFAICEAPIGGVPAAFARGQKFAASEFYRLSTQAGTTIVATSATPTPPGWLEFDAAGQGFHGTAYFAASHFVVGDYGKYEELEFEVRGRCLNAGGVHADPALVVVDLLTDPRFGVGLPTSAIDVTHGINGSTSSSFSTYCAARGIGVSRAVTSPEDAGELLDSLLEECNARPVWTGGKWVIVPWDDVAIGAYVPPSTAAVIDAEEIIRDGGDPVEIEDVPDSQVYNAWPVKFRNHQAEWNVSETEVEETSSTVRRRAAATEAKWLTEPNLALWFSSTLAQRSVHCRHFYKFKLAARWAALDPMDYVSLTEPTTGLDAVLCRIVSIKRNADGSLDVEALETPQGVATPVDLTPQAHDGFDSYTPIPSPPEAGPQGPQGPEGLSVAELTIYRRATSAPATPTGGSYAFGLLTLTPPSGWSVAIPAGTDPVYTSRSVASVQGTTGTDSTLTWSSPVLSLQNGAPGTNGTNGAAGARGSLTLYLNIAPASSWSESSATLAITYNPASGGVLRLGDTVTQYNDAANFAHTRFWDGSAWQVLTVKLDGNLLVGGTVGAEAFAGNVFKTPNYAFTGTEGTATECATAGAKMQNAPGGTALLTAPNNLKIGTHAIREYAGLVAKGVLLGVDDGASGTSWVLNEGMGVLSVSVGPAEPGRGGPDYTVRVELQSAPGRFDTPLVLWSFLPYQSSGVVNTSRAIYIGTWNGIYGTNPGFTYARGLQFGISGASAWFNPASISFRGFEIHFAVIKTFGD